MSDVSMIGGGLRGGDLPDWLRQRAAAYPDRPALVAGEERLSFGDLDRRVEQTARRLAGMGVTEGVRVALLLGNGVPFVVLTHVLARLGAVMVPLNIRLAPPEVVWQLADSRATVLIHDGSAAAAASAPAGASPAVVRISADALETAREAGIPPRDGIDLSSLQGIIYTSATSGRPKGVMLSFGNHWWNAIGSALHLGLRSDDCWLAPLPLVHVGGLAILWRSVIYGIPAVVHETFDPDAVNNEIDGGRVTLVSVVSTMLQRMLEARGSRPYPPNLRCILLGGGPAPQTLVEACVARGIPIAPTYGLTETASQVATLAPEDVARRPDSAGKALFPVELRIDANGRAAQAGEIGEIIVRGPSVMLGYADRPGETAEAIRDGWLHTADLGYLDGAGYLHVVERRDDLIISGGENVYPAEVESVLLAHPAVEDAGVIGLPDPVWGQTVAAAVKVRAGARVTEEEVKAFCDGRLAGFKIPRRVWFVATLPRSSAGKLIRRAICAQVSESIGTERR